MLKLRQFEGGRHYHDWSEHDDCAYNLLVRLCRQPDAATPEDPSLLLLLNGTTLVC
jgi:hypothetical protein